MQPASQPSDELQEALNLLEQTDEDVDKVEKLAGVLAKLRGREDLRRAEVLRMAAGALAAVSALPGVATSAQGPASVGALARLVTALLPGAAVGPGVLAAASATMAIQSTWEGAGERGSDGRRVPGASSPWVPVLPVLATDCLLQALRLVEVAGRGGLPAPAAAALCASITSARSLPAPPASKDTVQLLRGREHKQRAMEVVGTAGAVPFAPATAWRALRDAALGGNGSAGEG